MVGRRDQPRQFMRVVCLLATFMIGGSAAEPSLRAESVAAGRTLQAVESTSLGCFADDRHNRVLKATSMSADIMTPDGCAQTCLAEGSSKYYAVQFGRECWCGQEGVEYDKWGALPTSSCNEKCRGNKSIFCGGASAFEIFEYDGVRERLEKAEPLGCWKDVISKRVFGTPQTKSGTNTPQECEDNCDESDSAYFGVQNGEECFCGFASEDYTKHGTSNGCRVACTGDSLIDCGGRNAIEVFRLRAPSTPTPSTPPPATPTPAPVTPTSAPVTPPTPAPGTPTSAPVTPPPGALQGYLGCWADERKNRVFKLEPTERPDNTPENCRATCREYTFFGLQDGDECFCGEIGEDYKTHGESHECTAACSGGYTESPCGGHWAMAVYSTDDYTPPTPAPVPRFGGVDGCSVVIIEGEDLPLVGHWELKSDPGASGGQYIVWEGLQPEANNKSPYDGDIITVTVHITVRGTYRFKWRMRQPGGVAVDKANDTWLDFPDATRFGPLDDGDIAYPGFVKVYGRALDGDFGYSGKAEDGTTHDHSEIAVEFAEPGPYEMKIAGRSHGHEIDQIILYSENIHIDNAALGC